VRRDRDARRLSPRPAAPSAERIDSLLRREGKVALERNRERYQFILFSCRRFRVSNSSFKFIDKLIFSSGYL
jgi:hypothetical protein